MKGSTLMVEDGGSVKVVWPAPWFMTVCSGAHVCLQCTDIVLSHPLLHASWSQTCASAQSRHAIGLFGVEYHRGVAPCRPSHTHHKTTLSVSCSQTSLSAHVSANTNLSNSATLLLPTPSGPVSNQIPFLWCVPTSCVFSPGSIPYSFSFFPSCSLSPLLSFFLPLSPLLGEGLSSSHLSLHKAGASSSVANLSQRRESRVSVLLNHLLPSSHSNTGSAPGLSPLTTPQSTPAFFRRSPQSPPRSRGAGPGPHGIPEVVVSPPEDDDPPNSTEDEAASPQLSRRASSASQGLEMLPLEGKYLCSLPVWVTAWTENTSTSMKALLPVYL